MLNVKIETYNLYICPVTSRVNIMWTKTNLLNVSQLKHEDQNDGNDEEFYKPVAQNAEQLLRKSNATTCWKSWVSARRSEQH